MVPKSSGLVIDSSVLGLHLSGENRKSFGVMLQLVMLFEFLEVFAAVDLLSVKLISGLPFIADWDAGSKEGLCDIKNGEYRAGQASELTLLCFISEDLG